MVTLTRSGAELQWNNVDQIQFERFSGLQRAVMPVASSRVNCAVRRAAGHESGRRRDFSFNGMHRRRIRKIR